MRRLARSITALVLSLTLAAVSAALTFSAPIPIQGSYSSAALFIQDTPTPQQADESEIGSTDGIILMGGVIVVIIIAPIFLRRKAWLQS
jgi:hypothetical protein